jgi:thiamine transport system ATP-binding protein
MLEVSNVTVTFGSTAALDGLSLDVGKAEVVTVLGASGSGKSTLLRVIAGLQQPDAGRVVLDGQDLATVPPHRRGVGMVFQEHALFHHRDVGRNVGFGLELRGDQKTAIDARVRTLLELVGLLGFERRPVGTLSGGERQRVALARALAPEPRALLLDEPLGSLDRPLRERLLADLDRLFEEIGVTAVYVTHDQAEAFALGDRVAVMRDGSFAQVGTPDEVWGHPADAEVARFLGQSLRGTTAVRPEAVRVQIARDGAAGDGVVEFAVRAGPTVRIGIRLDDGSTLEAAMTAIEHPAPGDRVSVEVDPEGIVEVTETPAT